jgi:IPT/TIG domain-containing protein/PASTA domain-containing protein
MKQLRRENAASGSGNRSSGRIGAALGAAICSLALLAGSAQAATVTVGSVLPTTFSQVKFEQVRTLFNTALPEKGANLSSPVTGAVVRWRVQGAKGGPFYLRVLRPNGKGAYEAVGTSLPATPSGEGLQTFTTNLPIRAGDLIGVDPTNASDEIGVAEVPGASYSYIFPPPFNGSTVAPSGGVPGSEIELSAEVQAVPEVTKVAPASGSIKGGAEVTITGTSFNGASAVMFGNKPATSFTVGADTEIVATAPATTKPGKVDITVTTVAGTSAKVRADTFTYKACVVPGLRGKRLKAARNRLLDAGCRLGRVTKVAGPAGKAGKVVGQTPKAGRVLAPGSKVRVRVVRK